MNVIEGLAALRAGCGAEDFYDGLERRATDYWYEVGYRIASEKLEPQEAMDKVRADGFE